MAFWYVSAMPFDKTRVFLTKLVYQREFRVILKSCQYLCPLKSLQTCLSLERSSRTQVTGQISGWQLSHSSSSLLCCIWCSQYVLNSPVMKGWCDVTDSKILNFVSYSYLQVQSHFKKLRVNWTRQQQTWISQLEKLSMLHGAKVGNWLQPLGNSVMTLMNFLMLVLKWLAKHK